jgi:hypothetical protein
MKNNISVAKFITDIVLNLLNKPLSSNTYYALGGSKDIFRKCVERNKGIGDTCTETLINLIKQETKFDDIKKKVVLDYLKQYLTLKERNYMYRNQNDIKTIVTFAVSKFSPRSININNVSYGNENKFKLKIFSITELLEMGWTIEKYEQSVIKLWKDIIKDIPDEYIGDIEGWKKIILEHPETRKVLLDEKNNIIGYWEFDPLFDDTFTKAKNGTLLESDMQLNDIPYLISGTYNIYFENICITSAYGNNLVYEDLNKVPHKI